MKAFVKRFLHSIAPRAMTTVQSVRERAHSQRYLKKIRMGELNQKLAARFGNRVQTGPFAGMTLTPAVHREQLGPYLLGTYEQELHAWLARLLAHPPSRVVDIGCKFGYYAIGLSRQMPEVDIIAYDTDWWARRAAREMAAVNRTPRVDVRGYCTPADLAREVAAGGLVLCDCDGGEEFLFLTQPSMAFARATLLIETHDYVAPNVSGRLRDRFGSTHEVESVKSCRHDASALDLSGLTAEEQSHAASEIRPPQEWLLFSPRYDVSRSSTGHA